MSSHGQTDRQTDGKRLLGAHHALAQVGSKKKTSIFFYFAYQLLISGTCTRPTEMVCLSKFAEFLGEDDGTGLGKQEMAPN